MKDIAGKTVFITGAASGIGKAIAKAFAENSCNLILLDINEDPLNQLSAELKTIHHIDIITIPCNLASSDEIAKIKSAFFEQTDIFINNAGIGYSAPFLHRDFSEFKNIVAVNYLAVVQLTQRFLQSTTVKSTERAVVTISSPAGVFDIPYMAAYSSSKRAITTFINCLRLETNSEKMHFLTIYPGPTKTNFGKQYEGAGIKHGNFYNKYMVISPERVAKTVITGLRRNAQNIFIPATGRMVSAFASAFPILTKISAQFQRKNFN